MIKRLIVISFVLILLVGVNPDVIEANQLAKDSIKVSVSIPVFQQVEVIEPLSINLNEVSADLENGRDVIIEDAGRIAVKSNANWKLQVLGNQVPAGYSFFIRNSNDSNSRWQLVNGANSFNGKNGHRVMLFDLKIVSNGVGNNLRQNQISFNFMLSQI
mgnify:CR=1 FL=1